MPAGAEVGVVIPLENACDIYIDHAARSIEEQGISFKACASLWIRVTVLLAHVPGGSAAVGRRVSVINDDFDGMDINVRCGSTHLEPLRALMAETGADVGIAHDGDADRVMLMAPDGTEIDGDMVESAVCALDMRERGVLAGDTVVSTVMCNFGFVRAMKEMGINVVQTKVGDRYVLEAMREHGYSIGGEQSGHMILLDHNSTGDGLMTACQFLAAVIRSGKPVGEAIQVMEKMPQTLINVRVNDKHAVEGSAEGWPRCRGRR